MSVFKKNNNIINGYNNSKIISYTFKDNEIAYKYFMNAMYFDSIIHIKSGQEVIFIIDNDIEVISQEGYYIIDINNLNNSLKTLLLSNSNNMFYCNIYFINKLRPINCYWGTPNTILVDSEKYKTTLEIIANGTYTLVIDDSVKLLKTVLGVLQSYTFEEIDEFIFNEVLQIIVSIISNYLQNEGIIFSKLSSEILNISKKISYVLREEQVFENYGLKLKSLVTINTLKLKDEDMKIVKETDEELRKLEIQKAKIIGVGEAEAKATFEKGHVDNTLLYERGMTEAEILKIKDDISKTHSDKQNTDYENKDNNNSISIDHSNHILCKKCGTYNSNTAIFCITCNASLDGVYCNNCQEEITEDIIYCPKCGTLQKKDKTCSVCGEINEITSSFCKNCGNKF